MPGFGDDSLRGFATHLGERSPAPSGGAACAAAAALAAGAVEMAARFGGDERAAARAAQLREVLLALADEDARAYGRVLAAEGEARAAALTEAAGVPLEIAEAAAEAARLGARAAREGKPALVGDALAGVLLAEAAAQGAAQLVAINLAGSPGDERTGRARGAAEAAAISRSEALSASPPARGDRA